MAFRSYCSHPGSEKYVRTRACGKRELVCRVCHRAKMRRWRGRSPVDKRHEPRRDPLVLGRPVVWPELARRTWA